ncbi:MAG: hypothetical protein WKF84_15710 [Pyrinomonadaceae bacterium]
MLQTVRAEIDIDGSVRLLEPVRVERRTQALVTLLEEPAEPSSGKGNGAAILELLNSSEFAARKSYPVEEIEAQIQENRNSWE